MPPSVERFLATEADAEARARVEAVRRVQLEGLGMLPRDDSHLTILYAQKQADPELADDARLVAEELWVTDQIYARTLYGELLEEVMRRVAHRLRRRYGPQLTWTCTWQIVRAHVPTMLKLHCLLQQTRCHPTD